MSAKGLVAFRLKNPETSVWRGQVTLASTGKVRISGKASRQVTFARGRLVVAGGRKHTVRLQLSRASQVLVARLRRVSVTIAATPEGDEKQTSAATVLLPPRR
jgi:hypothetical protein